MANFDIPISYPTDGNNGCFHIEDESFWFQNRNRLIVGILGLFVKPTEIRSQRFLDLGGGNGFVAKSVQDMGFKTDLVEPGDGAENARKRGIHSVYQCTVAELPPQKHYEWIGLFDVVEHIDEPVPFLKSLESRLTPDGHLILTVPAFSFLWSGEDVVAGHFRRYTKRSLAAELTEAGYVIKFNSYFFSFLILPIFLLRTLPFLIKRSAEVDATLKSAANDHRSRGFLRAFVDFIFALERRIVCSRGFPFGASLIAVARRG